MTSVYESLFGVASTAPHRPCLHLDDGTVRTYGDLDRASSRLAAALAARGVDVGDRVVARVEKSPEAVALYLACLRGGFVYVPLNTAYTDEEVDFFVADADAALFVDDAVLADLDRSDGTHDIVDRSGDDWAAMLYTSGTTGRPKGAMLSCRNLVANARAANEAWHFSSDDVLVHILPVFHVHGLFVALHCAFLAGAAVRFHTRFEPDAVVRDLRRATVLTGVPTHYHRLLDHTDIDADACAGMRLFMSGSAPLLAGRHDEFAARTGHRIVERYGMTETMILTSSPYDGQRLAGTVGFPLPGVDVRIGAGDVVEVRGDGVFLGYWGLPDQTAAAFRDDGWFVTGDLGRLDDDGRLTLVGRQNDVIITGGLNVYPAEIEQVLDAVEGVVESAVVGVPDDDFGESVVAFVVGTADEHDLRSACRPLARFKHPRRYVVVDELPRNTMGKVQKAVLRTRAAG